MKCFLTLISICLSLLGFSQGGIPTDSVGGAFASNTGSERILNFHSDIIVNDKGDLDVTEIIKVNSLGDAIKHGITRTFLTTRNFNGGNQKVNLKVVSVTKDGTKQDYHSENGSGYFTIYIGDKNEILPPGVYEYAIRYTVAKQIGFFKDYDELYWNVNGTDWAFAIDKISAKVVLPKTVEILQNSCYTGEAKSTESNCDVNVLDKNTIEWSAVNFSNGENLTVAVGFTKGVILPPPPPSFLEKYGVLLLLGLSLLGFIVYSISMWKKYGIDPPKPTVYPQFNVPEDMSPASLGYIKKEKYATNFLTATLVNLSVKGYTKIIETESKGLLNLFNSKEFTIQKIKEPDQSLAKEEIGVMNDLFSNRSEVTLTGKYDPKIEKAVSMFQASLKVQHNKFLNEGNNGNLVLYPFLFLSFIYFIGLLLSALKRGDFGFMIVGFFIYVMAIVVYFVATRVLGKVPLKGFMGIFTIFFSLSFIIPFISMGFSIGMEKDFKYCFQFAIICLLIFLAFQYFIKRPSEEKLRKQSLIDGFKMYMGAAENEQLKFHNSPKMTPEIFEKYLPYAMVLGVDDIWGKKFEVALLAMAAGYTSSWYAGHYTGLHSFGSSLNSSLSRSISSGSTAPSNSSSGGSGSGGGGFSGGGGGGGGGGGW